MSEHEQWVPFEHRADITIPLENGSVNVQIDFSGSDQPSAKQKESIRTTIHDLLREGYRFLQDVVPQLRFAKELTVEVKGNRKHHGAQGSLLYISAEQLQPVFEGDVGAKKTQQSLIVHELVHQFTDEEDLPMLAELMYVQHSVNTERIEQLRMLYRDNKLVGKYEHGLQKIAEWYGFENTETLFDGLSGLDKERSKEIFQSQMQQLLRDEA